MQRALGRLMITAGAVVALLVVVGVVFFLTREPSAPQRVDSTAFRAEITTQGIHRHLDALQSIAGANGGNRAVGTPGFTATVDYVRQQLTEAGYQVETQSFRFPYFAETSPPVLAGISGGRPSYAVGPDLRGMTYSGSGDVTAPVRPVNLGAPDAPSASGCQASDFTGFERGTIALLRRGGCPFDVKARNAEAAGAAAVLITNDGRPGKTDPVSGTLERPGIRIPVLSISSQVAAEFSGPNPVTVHVAAHTVTDFRQAQNLVAQTAGGRDDRVVTVGAHLDSVPAGPGINDDGTGVATVLEVAKAMSRLHIAPANQVRFGFWGAEELGLLGSEHYVATLTPEQRADIAVNLNFDMLGSPNFVRFVYDGDGSTFAAKDKASAPPGSGAIEKVFTDYFSARNLAFEATEFDGRSDYAPFAEVGIPVGGMYTGAEEIKTPEQATRYGGVAGQAYDQCYHQACDTVQNVNDTVLAESAGAVTDAILHFAEQPTSPRPE